MKLRIWGIGAIVAIATMQVGCASNPQAFTGYNQQAPAVAGKKVVVNASNKTDFENVVAAVNEQMQPGGRYEFTSKQQRQQIDFHFAQMQALFDQYGNTDKMSDAQRTQLFNDQEFINGVLTHTDSRRLVCYRKCRSDRICPSRPVGRTVTSSMTANAARTTCTTQPWYRKPTQCLVVASQLARFIEQPSHIAVV